MYLLQSANFQGKYKLDLNPGGQTDTFNAIRDIENELLEYLLADYSFYIVNTPPNLLANALLTNRVNTSNNILIKHVTYSYVQYAVEYVYNHLKSKIVNRGEVKEDAVYDRVTSFNLKLMRVKKDFCEMFKFLKQKIFVTNAAGDLVIDLANDEFHYKPGFAILTFALGINFRDIQTNTLHTITSESVATSVYTYSFTPAPAANARLQVVLRLYDCKRSDVILA